MEVERMVNPVFQMLMGNRMPQPQNPIDTLAQRGINIPKENQGSSKDMVNYLLDSGAMDRNVFNRAYQKLQMMGFKF
jgi:hypothetical protein